MNSNKRISGEERVSLKDALGIFEEQRRRRPRRGAAARFERLLPLGRYLRSVRMAAGPSSDDRVEGTKAAFRSRRMKT